MEKLVGRTAIIVDVHPLWLDAMARLLEGVGVDIVAKSTDPRRGIELVHKHGPDMLVVGLGGGPADAKLLEAIPEIRREDPDVKVVMLAPTRDARAIEAALSMGVSAYCMKSAAPGDLMAAIRQSFEQSTLHEDDDEGEAAAGVREPRRPIKPQRGSGVALKPPNPDEPESRGPRPLGPGPNAAV